MHDGFAKLELLISQQQKTRGIATSIDPNLKDKLEDIYTEQPSTGSRSPPRAEVTVGSIFVLVVQ